MITYRIFPTGTSFWSVSRGHLWRKEYIRFVGKMVDGQEFFVWSESRLSAWSFDSVEDAKAAVLRLALSEVLERDDRVKRKAQRKEWVKNKAISFTPTDAEIRGAKP